MRARKSSGKRERTGGTDDAYLRRLDSLARYYNSQTTAHVGYLISVTGFLLGTSLAFSASVVLWTGNYQERIGLNDGFLRVIVPLVLFVALALWALGRFTFSLKYLLGGVQYNIVLSFIVFEHMGLQRQIDSNHVKMLRIRADRSDKGIEVALRSLFEARLFASKCREPGINRGERERRKMLLTKPNMAKFDVQENEGELVSGNDFQAPVLLKFRRLGFAQRELLFIRYRGYTSDERGRLVRSVFDP